MESEEKVVEDIRYIKRQFFAYRNGIIADTLRRAGSPFKIIFGLNLPQITEIAANAPHNPTISEALWENSSTRESMLIASLLYPVENFDRQTAARWIQQIKATEIADFLCLKLLRHTSYALDIAKECCLSDNEMTRYTGLRLFFNLVYTYPSEALSAALTDLDRPSQLTHRLASMLVDEASFVSKR